MNLELPKKIRLPFVQIKKGKLYLQENLRFEDLMYELTYKLRDKRCVYCGKKLNQKTCTLDHRYPRATGGISITNNLYPCCSKCNSEKAFLTHEEFIKIRKVSDENEKKNFLFQLEQYKKHLMAKRGFILPQKWISFLFLDQIKYKKSLTECRGRRYMKIKRFYDEYKKIPRPVIVDKNNKLLDGYNIILFANDNGIKKIPVIKLDNVILQKRS